MRSKWGAALAYLVLFAVVFADAARSLPADEASRHRPFDYYMFVRFHFTIHGLWPNYEDGTWPQFCDHSMLFDEDEVEDLLPKLEMEWPTYQDSNENFWAHEWNKHGTCALQQLRSEHQFFSTVLDLHNRLDLAAAFSAANIQPSSKPYDKQTLLAAIRNAFGVDAYIHCDEDSELSEIWMCIDKDLQPFSCTPEKAKNAPPCNSVMIPPLSKAVQASSDATVQQNASMQPEHAVDGSSKAAAEDQPDGYEGLHTDDSDGDPDDDDFDDNDDEDDENEIEDVDEGTTNQEEDEGDEDEAVEEEEQKGEEEEEKEVQESEEEDHGDKLKENEDEDEDKDKEVSEEDEQGNKEMVAEAMQVDGDQQQLQMPEEQKGQDDVKDDADNQGQDEHHYSKHDSEHTHGSERDHDHHHDRDHDKDSDQDREDKDVNKSKHHTKEHKDDHKHEHEHEHEHKHEDSKKHADAKHLKSSKKAKKEELMRACIIAVAGAVFAAILLATAIAGFARRMQPSLEDLAVAQWQQQQEQEQEQHYKQQEHVHSPKLSHRQVPDPEAALKQPLLGPQHPTV